MIKHQLIHWAVPINARDKENNMHGGGKNVKLHCSANIESKNR